MKTIHSFSIALAICLLAFTQCVVPFESARMLPKGSTELKASYSYVSAREDGEGEKLNDGLGFGLGYGVSDRFNLKFRYERVSTEGNLNFIAFGPKFALKPNRIAAALPVWSYFVEGESTWGISPTLLFNVLPPSKTFETNIGLRSDFFFEEDVDALIGLNLGFGISQDLDRWAIRPDFGLMLNPGESGVLLSFGLGAQYNIAPKAKK